MAVDLESLTLVLVVCTMTLAFAVTAVAWRRPSLGGLRWWGLGLVAQAAANAAFTLRYVHWPTVSIVLVNVLLTSTLAAHLHAVGIFLDARPRARTLVAPVVVMGVLAFLLRDEHVARNLVSAFLVGGQAIALATLAWRPTPGLPRERGRVLVVAGSTILALSFAARVAALALGRVPVTSPSLNDRVQATTYLAALVVVLLNTVGYVTMQLERAEERRHQEALHDALTGLANRRALLEALERECRRAMRTAQPLAALMLDLDHFKRVNDERGHLVGDAVLREVARHLAERVRAYDVVGRFGGEEFLVLLPGTTGEGAMAVAEALRHDLETPVRCGDEAIDVTVSIGVSSRVPVRDERGCEALIASADRALYRAKERGRNRCELEA